MESHSDKTHENKLESYSNAEAVQQSAEESQSPAQEDNRPTAEVQRELQNIVNNSPQVKQLKAVQRMVNNSAPSKPQALKAATEPHSIDQRPAQLMAATGQDCDKNDITANSPKNMRSNVESWLAEKGIEYTKENVKEGTQYKNSAGVSLTTVPGHIVTPPTMGRRVAAQLKNDDREEDLKDRPKQS